MKSLPWTAIIGLAGVVLGVLVKAAFDAWNERGRRRREDLVWRRQQTAPLASEVLRVGGSLRDQALELASAIEAHQAIVADPTLGGWGETASLREARVTTLTGEKNKLMRDADVLVNRLAMFVASDTLVAATEYLTACRREPKLPSTSVAQAKLTVAIREELGLTDPG